MGASFRTAGDTFGREFGAMDDRRDWQRVRARDTQAVISWKQDDGPHAQDCELLDISGGGMAILMAKVPPRGRLLTIQLVSLDRFSVEGRMVDCQLNRRPGKHLVRIRFIAECPPALFERAIHGLPGPGVLPES